MGSQRKEPDMAGKKWTRADIKVVRHGRKHWVVVCDRFSYCGMSGWVDRDRWSCSWFLHKADALAIAAVCPLPKGRKP